MWGRPRLRCRGGKGRAGCQARGDGLVSVSWGCSPGWGKQTSPCGLGALGSFSVAGGGLQAWAWLGGARVRPRTAPCSSQSTSGGLCYMGLDGQGLSTGQRASPRGPVLGHSHLDQCFQVLPCNGPEDGDRGPSGALLTSW